MARNFITGTMSVPAGWISFAGFEVFLDGARFAFLGVSARRMRVFLGFGATGFSVESTKAISE
jgi:hypothetical protein